MGSLAFLLLAVIPGLVLLWGGALLTGRWRTPGWFVATAAICAGAAAVTWFVGAFAGGLDVGEACQAAGAAYDDAYRSAHWREPSRLFPLHNRCNAGYDLVPAWVNPALVLLPLLAVASLVVAVRLATTRSRA